MARSCCCPREVVVLRISALGEQQEAVAVQGLVSRMWYSPQHLHCLLLVVGLAAAAEKGLEPGRRSASAQVMRCVNKGSYVHDLGCCCHPYLMSAINDINQVPEVIRNIIIIVHSSCSAAQVPTRATTRNLGHSTCSTIKITSASYDSRRHGLFAVLRQEHLS